MIASTTRCQFNEVITFCEQVHSSFVTSFLQSDIKVALKNAFANLEGPLSLTDWCKGRNQANDSSAINDPIDNIGNDIRDSSSINIRGESISPPQALSVSSSLLKGTFLLPSLILFPLEDLHQ